VAAVTAPRSLDAVRAAGGPAGFPVDLLTGCRTALVLFAARWHGRQDAAWIAKAGLHGTCVDLDGERLAEMKAIYPDGWEFVEGDAFDAPELAAGSDWDVVTLDPFTGLFQEVADRLDDWCQLANHLVVLGCGHDTDIVAPAGWKVARRTLRSTYRGGVYWTTLRRTAA
jgi:hypothetical protein